MTLTDYKAMTEESLKKAFEEYLSSPQQTLAEAMRYSLLAGGKRLRPALVLEFSRICGGDLNKTLPVACGIEMLHTYSLIHDDLPCMDNDDLRRGKPTNHVKFGVWQATLAGDALQAEAFGSVLKADLPAERTAECAAELAHAVGVDGMCGGQFLDMLWEGKQLSAEELDTINVRKTGALLVAACRMGVLSGGGNDAQLSAADAYGRALGLAFQIRDDMLDVLSTAEELGKPIGSDLEENKNTYMVLLGKDRCEALVNQLTEQAKSALKGAFEDTAFLDDLADSMACRNN